MALFTVRVELHGATPEQYKLLHDRMFAHGFKAFIAGVDNAGNKGSWALPTAEYDYEGEGSAAQVRDTALIVANAVKPNAWVLVTKCADRAWQTTKVRNS
jgi:hypothetical protein